MKGAHFQHNFLKTWKSTYILLRSEPEALAQFRQLMLTVVIGFCVAYGVNQLLVVPQTTKIATLEKTLVEYGSQQNSQEIIGLTTLLASLQKQTDDDQYELELLALKERFLVEHWANLGNNDNFNRLVFTLINSAPINFEQNLLQTTQLAKRDHDGFSIYPMTLEGNGEFAAFYKYLRFLESRPEVGFLDQVEISALPSDEINKDLVIEFKITIGRLELSHDG